jgi:hypothetical protein
MWSKIDNPDACKSPETDRLNLERPLSDRPRQAAIETADRTPSNEQPVEGVLASSDSFHRLVGAFLGSETTFRLTLAILQVSSTLVKPPHRAEAKPHLSGPAHPATPHATTPGFLTATNPRRVA